MRAVDTPPSHPASQAPPSQQESHWSAGIINHGSYDDLEDCLAALTSQNPSPRQIVVYDTGENPERLHALRLSLTHVDFLVGANRGYAGGANRVVDRLRETTESGGFILLLNPDVCLDPGYAKHLMAAMARQPRVAIATGKLLRLDRRTLDSTGIFIPQHRRPRDRGSDEEDLGQFDVAEFVDAASGAAMMLRSHVLADLEIDGELFDERFFAYHEDTDLCWRARLFGWQIYYEPLAVALHRRGWQRNRRQSISIETRRHSFKNHYLQILKNETALDFLRNGPRLFVWEILRLGFVLLRDRAMLSAYRDAWRLRREMILKREQIQCRARQRANGRSI